MRREKRDSSCRESIQFPIFLSGILDQERYERWLRRKALAHSSGDLKRFNQKHTAKKYRDLIHQAVQQSQGKDIYTGEDLHWNRIGTYSNEHSKSGKSKYKADFALLPTLDHIHKDDGTFEFAICGSRTNDAKNDLPLSETLDFCERVLIAHGYKIEKPARR